MRCRVKKSPPAGNVESADAPVASSRRCGAPDAITLSYFDVDFRILQGNRMRPPFRGAGLAQRGQMIIGVKKAGSSIGTLPGKDYPARKRSHSFLPARLNFTST